MIRIVKLTLHPEHVKDFLNYFDSVKQEINQFPGCKGMKLLKDRKENNILFTYSRWESEEDLENYRNSELFGKVWPLVKGWFKERAEAWSVDTYFNGFEQEIH
ncbi:MAG: antibiotic biosynthesis monooxygenase family protein [Brumimicrobium sp.]|nr:antibiotic biosynthesis monooxygenase family protein [Brumimicrobium sp.]